MRSPLELSIHLSEIIAKIASAVLERDDNEALQTIEKASALNADICDQLSDQPVPFQIH